MTAKIVIVEGATETKEYPLEGKVIFEVGQEPGVDISLDDPDVVPVHLKIYQENDEFHAFDLSGRGFLVNGRRNLKHSLRSGDLIAIGNHALRFEDEEAPGAGREVGTSTEHGEDENLQLMSRADGVTRPQSNEPRAELQVIKGNDAGKVFSLIEKPMSVMGRGIATDITVWDIRASRIHCRIDGRDERYVISDMNSSNGTYVNGIKLKKPHTLKAGDTIKIGSSVLQFDQN